MTLSDGRHWEDFQGAFWTYVRIDGGDVEDARSSTLKEYCMLSADQILQYLTTPWDFAAIISGAVCVCDAHGLALLNGTRCNRTDLQKRVAAKPVFSAQAGHPVSRLLADFLQTDEGARFYINVARLLADASEDEEFAPYLYGYSPGRKPESTANEDPELNSNPDEPEETP